MDDEKLIELVRKYEFLYNLKHSKYMDPSKKEIAWKEIANQLQQSAAACKERWQNLRDSYRRALSKKKGKSGHAAKNTKPWKYENEMAFVVPFFVKRKLQDSSENKSDGDESDHWTDDQHLSVNQYQSILPHAIKTESEEAKIEDGESDNHSIDTAPNSNNYSEGSEMEQNKPRARKRKMIELEKTASAVLFSRLLTYRCKPNNPREHNELDDFFLIMSDTVKKFSPYLQAVAKNKIFNVVSEMELQLLKPPTSSTSTP